MARCGYYVLGSVLLFTAIIWLSACACPKNPGPLSSDRPGQTTSPNVVPPCHPQVEVGWTHTENKDDNNTRTKSDQAPNTLLRIGVIPNGEVRIGYDGYTWQRNRPKNSEGSSSSGSGDANIGIKYRFLEASGWLPESAFLAQLSLPVGADNFTSHRADPSFLFAFTHTLTDTLSFSYNLGTAWKTEETASSTRHTLSLFKYTASLGLSLTDRLGAFVEFYGDIAITPSNNPANSFDGGFTFLILDNFQVDVSGGVGVSKAADDWFVGSGLTYRFPN